MRLFLLPISTRRALIYCERVPHTLAPGAKPPLADRIIDKSSNLWTSWEKAESGWQRKVTDYGNSLFRRIPFEEWGLKTIPPATKKRLEDVDEGKLRFECLYPGAFLKQERVEAVLERIAKERQSLHKRKLWQCFAWMPVTIPFAAVPVIPNLPFFYLCFRAYSHYRALYGGRLLAHLLARNSVTATASPRLDAMYSVGLAHASRQASREAAEPSKEDVERVARDVEARARTGGDDTTTSTTAQEEEVMLLRKWNGKLLAEGFGLPEMEVEIERAVEQVEEAIGKRREGNEKESKSKDI